MIRFKECSVYLVDSIQNEVCVVVDCTDLIGVGHTVDYLIQTLVGGWISGWVGGCSGGLVGGSGDEWVGVWLGG